MKTSPGPLLKTVLAFLLLLPLAACTTAWLMSNTRHSHDDISGFYLTGDSHSLVVIGKRHHYIFPLDDELKSVLLWKQRHKLTAGFNTFRLGKDQSIEGSYFIHARSSALTDEDTDALIAMGFMEARDGVNLVRKITGQVYEAQPLPVVSSFNKPYRVPIEEDVNRPKMVTYALTPVAVAVDGSLWIGGIALVSVGCIVGDLAGGQCFR